MQIRPLSLARAGICFKCACLLCELIDGCCSCASCGALGEHLRQVHSVQSDCLETAPPGSSREGILHCRSLNVSSAAWGNSLVVGRGSLRILERI